MFITDVFSRRILGWRVTRSKTAPFVLSALGQALVTRGRTSFEFITDGLLHHSDAGSQYTLLAFTEALIDAGITGSIGTVSDALDNALMKSTISLFKTEVIDHERLHSSIGDVPPAELEQSHNDPTRKHDGPVAA